MNSRSSLASLLAPNVISAAVVPETGAADVPTFVEEDADTGIATTVDPAVAGINTDEDSPTAVGVAVVIAPALAESSAADDSVV